jgi:hypothetical protein
MALENWASCQDLFNQNRSRFKQLCYEYDTRTPAAIKRLIENGDTYSHAARFKQRIIHECFNSCHLSSEQKVKCAAKYLLENNEPPSIKTISKMTGISGGSLGITYDYMILSYNRKSCSKRREMQISKMPLSYYVPVKCQFQRLQFRHILVGPFGISKNHILILFIHIWPNRKFHISLASFFA